MNLYEITYGYCNEIRGIEYVEAEDELGAVEEFGEVGYDEYVVHKVEFIVDEL